MMSQSRTCKAETVADEMENQPQETPEEERERLLIETSPYARCATCVHAGEIDPDKGALLCARHNMRIDAEADEIPDDCPQYQRDPAKNPPSDPVEPAP